MLSPWYHARLAGNTNGRYATIPVGESMNDALHHHHYFTTIHTTSAWGNVVCLFVVAQAHLQVERNHAHQVRGAARWNEIVQIHDEHMAAHAPDLAGGTGRERAAFTPTIFLHPRHGTFLARRARTNQRTPRHHTTMRGVGRNLFDSPLTPACQV